MYTRPKWILNMYALLKVQSTQVHMHARPHCMLCNLHIPCRALYTCTLHCALCTLHTAHSGLRTMCTAHHLPFARCALHLMSRSSKTSLLGTLW